MAKPRPLNPDKLERLIADLDAGLLDADLPVQPEVEPAPLQKFSDVKPFDVLEWAQRRGIKKPAG